jgi:hypothetical protein
VEIRGGQLRRRRTISTAQREFHVETHKSFSHLVEKNLGNDRDDSRHDVFQLLILHQIAFSKFEEVNPEDYRAILGA